MEKEMGQIKLTARDIILILLLVLNTALIMTGHQQLETKVTDLTVAAAAAVHQCQAALR